MEVLFSINIAVALVMLLWPVWFSRTALKLPLLNPFTIALMLDFPIQIMKLLVGPMILIDGGLFDPGYQVALSMGTLLSVAQLAGLLFFLGGFTALRIERNIPLVDVSLTSRDLARAYRLFLLVYWLAMYLLASSDFGVINWLTNPREGYQLHRQGLGHWYGLAISSLAVAVTLAFLAHPTPRSLLLRAPLFIGMAYLFGSKTILLSIFVSLLIFLWFLRWKHLTKLFLIGTPLIFSLMVWNLYLALADSFDLQSIFEYFDYYRNAADYYRGVLAGDIQLYHGEITLSSLWSYVPRALVPDKPFVYGILHINELFFPGQAELTNTPAFGGAVEQFADFGVLGVIFGGLFSAQSFVTALLSYLLFRRPGVRVTQVNMATALVMIMQYAPGFGVFFPGALYIILLGLAAILIGAMRTRKRPNGHRPARAAPTASLELQ